MKPADNPDPFDFDIFDIFASVSDSLPPSPPTPPIDMRALHEKARQNLERAHAEWQVRLEVAIPTYWNEKPLRSREDLSPVEIGQMRVVAKRLRAEQNRVAKVRLQKPQLARLTPSPRVFTSNDACLWAARDVLEASDNTFLLRDDDSRAFFAQWPKVKPLGHSRRRHTFQTWAARRAQLLQWEHTHSDIAYLERMMREHGGSGEYWIESRGSYSGPLAADNTDALWHWDGAELEFIKIYAFSVS